METKVNPQLIKYVKKCPVCGNETFTEPENLKNSKLILNNTEDNLNNNSLLPIKFAICNQCHYIMLFTND